MRIILVYDVRENIFTQNAELLTELFEPREANAILRALKENGHEVEVIDGATNFAHQASALVKRASLVFNEAKGLYGPDRKMVVPAICKIYGIPYLGSDAYAVTLARNKWHTTAVARALGIRVPRTCLYSSPEECETNRWRGYPAFVKPNFESSSIGISDLSLVHGAKELIIQAENVIKKFSQPAVVQSFIPGIELQVCLVGNGRDVRVLGVQELRAEDHAGRLRPFLRNEDWNTTNITFPSWNNHALTSKVITWSRMLFNALGLSDYGRIDFRLSESSELFFIEASTHPHITENSSFLAAAESNSLSFNELIELLVSTALLRHSSNS